MGCENRMGKKKGWFGRSLHTFLQWCRDLLFDEPDWAIGECVAGFDHFILVELVGHVYNVYVLFIDPQKQGVPARRRRKYMLMLKRKKLKWIKWIMDRGVQQSFDCFFATNFNNCVFHIINIK